MHEKVYQKFTKGRATLTLYRSPRRLQSAGLKASDKVLSLSAEVAAQKRHSRMEKVCISCTALEPFVTEFSVDPLPNM